MNFNDINFLKTPQVNKDIRLPEGSLLNKDKKLFFLSQSNLQKTIRRVLRESVHNSLQEAENNEKLNESITIENPQPDEYNDIFVDGNKIGYIVLSPARKEYYWMDINLPNPLSLVDIKIFNEFRGKNYLTETMKWLEGFAKDKGYKSLFLRVDDNSEISSDILFQIYQKYGFRPYKTVDEEEDIFMYKLLVDL